MQNQHFLPRPGDLCRHRKASSCAKTTHRSWIEPVAGLVDIDYAPTIAHDIATIAHHRRILVNKITYLAAEAHGVKWYSIGTHQRSIASQRPAFLGTDVLEPVALIKLFRGFRQLVHTHSYISRQANHCPPVDAHVFTRQVKPDHVCLCWNKRRLA